MAMSKLDFITIFIVAICIAALGFLVFKTVGIMGTDDPTPTEEPVVDNTTIDEAAEYDFDDEGNIKDGSTTTTDDDEYPIDGSDTDNSNEDDTETLDLDDDEETTSTDDDVDTNQSNSNGGDYLVLAGTYKEKVNAEIQVRKLQKMGYDNAEVKSFNRGAYAVALVDRFDNFSEAAALRNKLADKGIDVFVKKKK